MRGKLMSTAAVALLAWSSNSFAVNVEYQGTLTDSTYEAKTALPLPSVAVRAELTQQLMEIAITGIHPVFSDSWIQLTKQPALAQNPETYYRIYSLLSQFRRNWHALDWDSRQHFHLKNFRPDISSVSRHDYAALLQASDVESRIDKLRPQTENYLASRRVLLSLLNDSRKAPWPKLPDLRIKPGDTHEALPVIRDVLMRSGDLQAETWTAEQMKSPVYDDQTVLAVEHFQKRHGLDADGAIGHRTLSWLRLPPQIRAVILARSILRGDIPQNVSSHRYVLVNIPEFRLRVLDKQQEIFTSRVIVGKTERPTPILSSEISSIVVNPAWHVPSRILQQDLVPKLLKDKHFLDKGQYEVVNSQGETVDPSEVVWDGSEENFPYRLRQKPGDHNALGRYKFYLPNNDAIYLHSTSSPGYFKRDLRALSSGCVRVEEADSLARLLLKNSKWDMSKLDQFLKEDTTKWLPVVDPIPVYTVYWRSWVDKKGQLQLRDDIYQFDDDAKMANTAVVNSLIGHG
ncbi:L,D-transpeptidase family protein [Tolumonas lignilytica]|uniref:L,D-transpeptidase family protein n=1 Tax=Tolumonas lignilytica TaxID=1283284 RepID=UPI000466418D|nr:L,D-transpeptidase family protein [Tolumonas lignilytica]